MDIEKKINRCIGYGLVFLTFIQPLQPAMAAAITAKDNNTKIQNINNVPVINIAKPNQAGISHNQFVDFNVSEKGVILNNSNSAGNSQLAGKINTKGVTLTTGTPSFDKNGAIKALTTTKGNIVIGTNGMDTSNIDYTDIISRTAEINGQLKAQKLTLIQGANQIDYATGEVKTLNTNNTKPSISIDTKALGGMYANSIRLVSTEAGVGVNLNNIVSNKGDIILATDGKIQLGNVKSNNNLHINSKTLDVSNNKKITSAGNITIVTDTLNNTASQISANRDMRIYADNIVNKQATIEANDNLWIQKDGKGKRAKSLQNISGTIKINNGDLVIRSDQVENLNPIVVNSQKIEPNSTDVENKFSFNQTNSDSVIMAVDAGMMLIFLAKLDGFDQKKWFGSINLNKSDYINSARKSIDYTSSNMSLISAGKNLYINSDTLTNVSSKLFSQKDMFLTGETLNLSYNLFGFENTYLKYLDMSNTYNDNRYLPFDKFLQYSYDSFKKYGYKYDEVFDINFTKIREEIVLKTQKELLSPIVANGNLIADYQGDINFSANNLDKYDHIVNLKDNNIAISAGKDLVLSGKNIKGYGNTQSVGATTLLANGAIELNNVNLNSKKDVTLVAVNDIKLNQTRVSGNDVSVISRNGDVVAVTADKTHYLDSNGEQIFGEWNVKQKLDVNAGKSINFNDQVINVGNDISLYAGDSVTLKNSNSLLEKNDNPTQVRTLYDVDYFNRIFHKTNNINIAGEATLRAGKDVNLDGIKIKSAKAVNIIADNDVILTPRILDAQLRQQYLPEEQEPELSSVIDAGGDVYIYSGRDLLSKAATIQSNKNIDLLVGRDFLLLAVKYTINKSNSTDVKHVVTVIDAGKKLTVVANGNILAKGASFESDGDMQLSSHGKMEFKSVENNNETSQGKSKSASTVQQSVVLSSGGNLNLVSDSSILFQATDIDAQKSIHAAAKGGFLFAQAMQETSYYQTKKTKRKWYGKKKKTVKTSSKVINKVVDFSANDNITLISAGDSLYQASQIKAGKDITLSSTNGKIIFEGVKDYEFYQKVVDSKGFYIKHSDKGYEKETWKLPSILAGGKLTVDAAKGITADIKAEKNQSLQNAITLLGNSEGTRWLKDLNKKGNVEWNKVQDAYASWNYEVESLNPIVAAVIVVAVAVATAGVGAAAGGAVAGSIGATGMTSTVVANSVAAGITALSSKAAVSLVENKGNISKTLHDLASQESVKSIATSMVIGGAMAGFDQALGLGQNTNPHTNVGLIDNSKKLTLISNGDWTKVAQNVIGHSIIYSTINSAINGGSFKERFSTALLSNVGNQVNAEGANFIGHSGYINSLPAKLISHSVMSAISAEIGGGNGKGAAAGAFAAELAAVSLGDHFLSTSDSLTAYHQAMLNLGKITGAIAGALVSHSAEGVYSGSNAGYLVVENNNLLTLPLEACVIATSCRGFVAKKILEYGIKAGITAIVAKEIADNISSEDLDHLITLNLMGNDEITNRYLGYLADKYATKIAIDPNDERFKPSEGYPIPEEPKPIIISTPIPEQDKDAGKLVTPIVEQDKNEGIYAGSEINVGDWQDYILTAEITRGEHAEIRNKQGRPVGQVINDIENSKPSDILVQDDGRWVILGPKGRVHIIEPDGEIVTSIVNKRSNTLNRIKDGRWERPSSEKLQEFKDKFSDYIKR